MTTVGQRLQQDSLELHESQLKDIERKIQDEESQLQALFGEADLLAKKRRRVQKLADLEDKAKMLVTPR